MAGTPNRGSSWFGIPANHLYIERQFDKRPDKLHFSENIFFFAFAESPQMQAHVFKASMMMLFILASCKQRDIVIDVARQSSDLMNCTKIFGYSVKKLEEENEILIQTGIFYANGDGEDKPAAIMKVNNTDRVLYLITEKAISGEKTEVYEGDGYCLSLRYIERLKANGIYFDGRCRIRKGITISEYKIEGQPNIHNY
jgi:hypothetical protein